MSKIDFSKTVYFENLDGLRALAALSVIITHSCYWFSIDKDETFKIIAYILSFGGTGGRLGVIFFFILSGFLITFLMYLELKKHGRFNIKKFYIRRFLRIWPLYYYSVFIGFYLFPKLLLLFKQIQIHENSSLISYILFAANFDHIYNGYPTLSILGVHWSVSVEEQFYLLWPLVFFVFNSKKSFPYLLLTFVLISEIYLYLMGSKIPGGAGDYHLISCVKYLSYGALIAWMCINKTEYIVNNLNNLNKLTIFTIYVLGFLTLYIQNNITAIFPIYQHLYHIIPSIFFSFIIIEQNFSYKSFFKLKNYSLLNWLGKLSYGMYLNHMIVINIITNIETFSSFNPIIKLISTLILTTILSYFTYKFIESPFLKLKGNFAPK